MNVEQVREYTLSIFGVTEDQPFGDDIITFRIEGKIFLCLSLGQGQNDMRDSVVHIFNTDMSVFATFEYD